jgi:hypothetical protein
VRTLKIITCLALSAFPAMTGAQCTLNNVSVTFTNGNGTESCSITPVTGGKYDISVNRGSNTLTVTVLVRAGSTDQIRHLFVTSNATWPTWVYVRGINTGTALGSVDDITRFGTGGGDVSLNELLVSGNLGVIGSVNEAIDLDNVFSVFVGGNLQNTIIARVGALDNIDVGGAINGDLVSVNSSINRVVAGGAVGASSAINIRSKSHLKFLEAASINANVDTKYNSGTGDLWYLGTTSGSFSGSLNTRNIQGSNVSVGNGLSISGNLNASVTVSENVDEPIAIGGSLASGSTIKIAKGLRYGSGNLGPISVGVNGLVGQIVINSGNATSTAWVGSVTVGATTLSPIPTTPTRPPASAAALSAKCPTSATLRIAPIPRRSSPAGAPR